MKDNPTPIILVIYILGLYAGWFIGKNNLPVLMLIAAAVGATLITIIMEDR